MRQDGERMAGFKQARCLSHTCRGLELSSGCCSSSCSAATWPLCPAADSAAGSCCFCMCTCTQTRVSVLLRHLATLESVEKILPFSLYPLTQLHHPCMCHLHVQHHQSHDPHTAAAGCCYQEICAGPHPLQRSLGRMLLLQVVVVVWGRLVLRHWLLLLLLWLGCVQMQRLLQMVVCQSCRATEVQLLQLHLHEDMCMPFLLAVLGLLVCFMLLLLLLRQRGSS